MTDRIDRTPNTGDKSTCAECHWEIFWTGQSWVHSSNVGDDGTLGGPGAGVRVLPHHIVPLTCPVEDCGWRAPFHVETPDDWEEMLELHAVVTTAHALDQNARPE